MLALLALSCSKEENFKPKNETQKQEINVSEKTTEKGIEASASGCPSGYKYCGHRWCVPYFTKKVCSKDVNSEYTTTILESMVCYHTWSSVSTKSHAYQVTWDSWYQATADNSGHTRNINYRCSNNLTCGMACGQTKSYYSGWQAHVAGSGSPRKCSLCGSRY